MTDPKPPASPASAISRPAGAGPALVPFRALRFSAAAGDLGALIAPPYDVISPAEQERLHARSPHNVVRLELPEGATVEERASRAAATLATWRAAGAVERDAEAAFYLHEHSFVHEGGRRRRQGFFALVGLDATGERIKPHERTLAAPRADRLEMLRRLRVQASPVLATYRPATPLPEPDGKPDFEAEAGGDRHRLWRWSGEAERARLLAAVGSSPLYIADGHHRYATALAYREERRKGPGEPGDGAAEHVLMGLVPTDEMLVLPWHRLVKRRELPDAAAMRTRLERFFTLTPAEPGTLAAALARTSGSGPGPAFGLVGLEPGRIDRAYLLTVRDADAVAATLPAERSPAWRALDLAVLERALLGACLDIDAAAVEAGALGYTHEAGRALDEVASGRAALAVLVNPTPVEQVLAVADARDLMPQKSTYFHPKLPTGLVLHDLA